MLVGAHAACAERQTSNSMLPPKHWDFQRSCVTVKLQASAAITSAVGILAQCAQHRRTSCTIGNPICK
jgi:hypothetical protein